MNNDYGTTLTTLKSVIRRHFEQYGITIIKTVLFGSRAVHQERADSDWDIMVITDKQLGFQEKWALLTPIKRELAEHGIPNDIVVKSDSQYRIDVTSTGTIAYYIDKQGVTI